MNVKTEKTILENLNATLTDKTVIFVTHRFSAIVNFDKILLLENGRITEQGNHAELMALKGSYYDIYQLQQAETADTEF